ncbi:hypothetical protein FOCC_FOCC006037 [Frankliniella occidentalis]|nr:hypothetical protein FOCC_FOCC006037 [Frankliniella occidentalis]
MQVDKLRYSPSDRLRANCSVPSSLPPANVTWTVNGAPVPNHSVTTTPTNCTGTSSLTTRCGAVSLLDMEVQGGSFHLGSLRIECAAHVWTLYHAAVHRDVGEEKPRLGASVLGNRDSAGNFASCMARFSSFTSPVQWNMARARQLCLDCCGLAERDL